MPKQKTRVIINVNSDWRVRSDGLQWIIEQKMSLRKRMPGDKRGPGKATGASYTHWKARGFHSQIDSAAWQVGELQLKELEGEYESPALEMLSQTLWDIKMDIKSMMTKHVITENNNESSLETKEKS